MTRIELAGERFRQGYNCAQSVFLPFALESGLDEKRALDLAAVMGGGIARNGETCGALAGALMALGLLRGMPDPADNAGKDGLYAEAAELRRAFEERFGASRCPELLGEHLGTPEGLANARAQKLFTTRCPQFVETAVRLMDEKWEAPETEPRR